MRDRRVPGIGFETLDNGIYSCDDPTALQAISSSFGPQHVEAFARNWLARSPPPLTAEDRSHRLRL